MQDRNNSFFAKWVLNDQYYHRLIAISLVLLVAVFILILNTLEPIEHSKEFERFRSKPAEEVVNTNRR